MYCAKGLGEQDEQFFAQVLCFLTVEFHDETSAAFQWDAHDVSAPFLGHLERAIARSRLHRGHAGPLSHHKPTGSGTIIIPDALTPQWAGAGHQIPPVPQTSVARP